MRYLYLILLSLLASPLSAQIVHLPSLNKVVLGPNEIREPSYASVSILNNELIQAENELEMLIKEAWPLDDEQEQAFNKEKEDLAYIKEEIDYYLKDHANQRFIEDYSPDKCYRLNEETYRGADLEITEVYWADELDLEFPKMKMKFSPSKATWEKRLKENHDGDDPKDYVACRILIPEHYTIPSYSPETKILTMPSNIEKISVNDYQYLPNEDNPIMLVKSKLSGKILEVLEWEEVNCEE